MKTFISAFRKAVLSPAKAKTSYSQFAEDLIIQFELKDQQSEPIYVDVGCNNPRRGSNTFLLYKKGWRGLLIDLEYEKILACKLARPRDKSILAAVSDVRELVDIYSQKSFSTNTTIAPECISDTSTYKKIGQIETKTLNEILKENQIPKCFSFLNIDVEGVDFKVLKSLNFDEYQPTLICIENWDSRGGIDKIVASEIHQYIVQKNYTLCAWSGLSTIYKKDPKLCI
ncbi:FkbM family methyltransferase [Polynucleobacter sp. AM-26B4]|uniref:FkbM family methyltransferase n=1 Tax=Polynucleobacter sp. AM-26B4 TaxID=2689103 RepID=UPI001C0E45AC|nr:FkbM family methyltransferase [Polynucleobacter sp. AM-26B4]MBU3585052.1 FkbM family methyltransferase [Polynucleobacter sp. AM-26B4]